MLFIDYPTIVKNRPLSFFFDSTEWFEWREAYDGGRKYRERYLAKLSDRETEDEFKRRKEMTPLPTYAKREINRVRNALFQRFADVVRSGGSKTYMEAVLGDKRGIDNRGSSLNTYLGKELLPELLVMGAVGVLVDAPKVSGGTLADVPDNYRPFVSYYTLEQIPQLWPSKPGSLSDYDAVLLTDYHEAADWKTGQRDHKTTQRFYYVGEDGFVRLQILNDKGELIGAEQKMELREIPFILVDIGDSLIKDVVTHQRALMNLASTDTNYALESNFPFLTSERGNVQDGGHLDGDTQTQEVVVGVKKGMKYDKGANRPEFIAPPADTLKASMELQKALKEQVRELVMGCLEDMGDGSIEAGLSFIGLCLEHFENRLGDHWTAFETAAAPDRERPTIKYPDCWALIPPKERIEEAKELDALAFSIPSRMGKKALKKLIADRLLRTRIPTTELDKIKKEIDDAPYCTSDPAVVMPAIKEGAMSRETGCLALGGDEKEAQKAADEQAKRAQDIAIAQADAAAARGLPDGSVTPGKSAADEKEGSKNPNDKLGGGGEGQRGKGAAPKE